MSDQTPYPNLQFLTRHGWNVLAHDLSAGVIFAQDTVVDPKNFALVLLGKTHTSAVPSYVMNTYASRQDIFEYLRRVDVERRFATPQAYGKFTVKVDEELLARGL